MNPPAWLLLIWVGLGAAIAAAAVGAMIGGLPVASWSLAPQPRSRLVGAAWSLLAGLIVYPVVYGVLFELIGQADLAIGLVLGALHGAIIFVAIHHEDSTRLALRGAAMHIAYGAAIGFLYVTP